MPKVEFENEQYEVPDGLSDEDILNLVREERNARAADRAQAQIPPGIPQEFPVVSSEKQLERDQLAAKIRFQEVGGDAAAIASRVEELKDALQARPMNGSARKMLKLELKLWEMAQEVEK